MFKGTRHHSAASLARLVDRVGGDLNAWTDREEMAFTCTVPAEDWAVAVEALSELCLTPTFPRDEFEREKDVIRNEILASLEDPEELSYEAYLQGLSPGPWSRPVAGTEESLDRISTEDPQQWWNQWALPSRLTIAFCGGVEPELVEGVLRDRFQDLSGRTGQDGPPPAHFSPGPLRKVYRAASQMVQVIGGFHFPAPATARGALVWQVFSMLWGETMSSRLFQSIREQRGLSYNVSSQIFDADRYWGLQHFASGSVSNTAVLVEALEDEVQRLFRNPPSVQEWEDAQAALRGSVILGSERTENRVGRLWRQYESYGELVGTDQVWKLLSIPVTPAERDGVLAVLARQEPSLCVWGHVPRRFVLTPGDS